MRKVLVILAACALVAAFTTPSFAEMKGAAVNIYGNVRFDTFSDKVSATLARARNGTNFDDRDTWWFGDWANSRLGINFKAGDVSANWEWRPNTGPYVPAPGIGSNVRQFWGAWDFGQGKIVVGQTWDPIFLGGACSTAARASGTFVGGYGDLAGCLRVAQIALWFKGLKIAFSTPTTGNPTGAPSGTWDTDATFPKVTAMYQFKWEPLWLNLLGGFEQFKLGNKATDMEVNVNSYLYGLQIGYAAGPFTARGLLWKCVNPWEFGLFGYGPVNLTGVSPQVTSYDAVYLPATNQLVDSNLVGYALTGSFKINDMFTIAGGYLGLESSRDALAAGTASAKNDAAAYYINLPITLAKNVKVVPEIGRIDEKDQRLANGLVVDDGFVEWFGAWWYIGW